jgi:hypothetical protein
LSGTLGFDTTATQSSPVGSYDVTPKGLTSNNYNITFGKGHLSVTKATLTVTADNKSKTYGDANPSLTPSYTGWKNADTASVLTGSPDLSTTATQGSNVGTYDITAAQGTLSANNYSFTFAKGTLTINKADLTVKADDKSKTYGDDNPNFTPSYSGWKNGDTASVLTGSPALSTTATQGSKAGTYAITAAVGTLARTTTSSLSRTVP